MITRVKEFLKGVEYELKKVSWPSGTELRGSTAVVIVLSIILVLFLFTMDYALSRIVSLIL